MIFVKNIQYTEVGSDTSALFDWAKTQNECCCLFLSRVRLLTRYIDIANLSVRLSVRYVPVSDKNGLTYRHSFFYRTVAQSF